MPHDNIPYLHAVFPRTRMCRKRRTLWIRRLVAETHLQINDIEIYRRHATYGTRLIIRHKRQMLITSHRIMRCLRGYLSLFSRKRKPKNMVIIKRNIIAHNAS